MDKFKNRKIIQRAISLFLCIALIFTSIHISQIVNNDISGEENVTVNVINKPKIDVLLTKGQTNTNLTTFENDIKISLQNKGIDTSNIIFQTVDAGETKTEATDAAVIFNTWQKFGKGGQWSLNTYNGVTTILNTENTQGLTGFYSKDTQNLTDMTMEFDFMPYDNDDDFIGVILRFNMDDDKSNTNKPLSTKISGYWYWENAGDAQGVGDWNWSKASGLYRAKEIVLPGNYGDYWYVNENNPENSYYLGGLPTIDSNAWSTQTGNTRLIPYSTNFKWTSRSWTHYKFQIEGNTFRGWRDGIEICEYTDTSNEAISTGTFALINQSQASRYKNFVCSYKYYKKYTEVLSQPTWRDDATHVIVNVNDVVDNSLTEPAVAAETNSKNIHFIQWGTDTNKTFTEDFISKNNDKKGIFTYNTNYNQAVEDTATYIKNLIEQESDSQYVVVGQDTDIVVTPASLKNNAVSTDFPNGRWYINHDYQYYDNNLGQSTQAGAFTPDLTCNFDKPGKYDIYFDGQDTDHLVKTVYAHRLPVADFTISINGSSLVLTSESKDLDDNTNKGYGPGIKSEKWYYKTLNDNTWTNGKLTTFNKDVIYLIKLEIEDFQGATAYTTKYIGEGNPVANFNLSSYNFSKYQTTQINDTSYDPEGYDITGWSWTLKKGSDTVATSTSKTPSFDFKTYGTGDYKLSLVVTNSQRTQSTEYTRSFTVIDDTDVPEIIVSPTNCEWKTSQSIQLIFSDADSGFKQWRYVFTDSQDTPTSGWSSFKTTATDSITLSSNGQKYLHIEAYDNAGNVLKRSFGIYKIDNDKPVINDVTKNEELHKTTVNIDASDNTSGVDKYTYTTSNIAPTSGWVSNQSAIITAPNTYYFWVKDYAGNVSLSHVETVKIKYQLTYDRTTNGGTGSNTTVTCLNGDSVDLTPTATKTTGGYGWEFVGWNTDPNAKEGLESFTMPANDVTLYAIYRRYVVLEFYDYNGTVTKDYRMDGYVYNNETGLKLTTPEAGTYTGYPESGAWDFLYFVNNSSSTDLTKEPKEIYYANTESIFPKSEKYFAVYKRTVPISFVSINGTAKQTQNVNVDQKISAKTALSMTKLTLTAPTAYKASSSNGVEWAFKHWKESTSFIEDSDEEKALPKYSEGQTFTASKKTTYYAVYERTANITFHDYKDGSKHTFKKGSLQLVNAYNPKSYNTKGIELPDANEMTGWTFLGWTENGEVLDYDYSSGETVYVTKPMDMYAIYEKPININFVYIDTSGNKQTDTVESTQYANANDINAYATDAEYTAPTINSFVYNSKTWKPLYWSKNTTSNASKSLAFGEEATTKTDLTYYAVYSSKMTAEFISIMGNDNVPTYVEGTTYTNANDKTKQTAATITAPSLNTCTVDSKTWTAKGWSEGTAYNSAIIVNPGATVTLTGNKTFYGIYASAYTATFVDYNKTAQNTTEVSVGSMVNSYDKAIHFNEGTAPEIGIYNDGTSDWVINGWTTSTDPNATKEVDSSGKFNITSDTTFYALYTRDVTVNLVDFVSGASTTTKKTAKAYVNSYNIDNKTDAAFTIPAQNGHVTNGKSWNAVGWTTSSSSSSLGDIKYYSAQTISTNKDITIYAMYTRDITVTYNGNGGTNPASSTGTKIINASGATSNPLIQITNTIPVRTSLKFANKWLTGIKSGTEYIPGLYYQFADDTTLYAQWILETVDLTATINWEDNSNVMNSRPELIRLSVYRDGQKISSHLITNLDDTILAPTANKTIPSEGIKVAVDKDSNTMTYTFTELQKYNPSNGAAYNYTLVQEPFISNNSNVKYTQVYSADTWTITNVMVDENNKVINGTIHWYDDSNAWHLRPSELTITLLKKDPDTNVVTKQTKTVKAGASDSVSYIFEKQAAVNSNKKPYEYTVSINKVTLYTVSNTDFNFECALANLPGGFTGGEGNNLIIAADAFNWKGNVAKADDYFATATNEDMSVLVTLKTIKKTWTGSGKNRHEVWDNNQYMTDDKGDVVEYNVIVSPDHNTQVDYLPDGRYELIVHDSSLFDFKKFAAANYELNNATITEDNGRYFITFEAQYESSSILNLHAQVILKGWRGYTSIKEYMYQPVHVFGDEWVYGDPASCEEDGFKYHVCVLCGARSSQGEIVPAYGHTFVNGYCTECGAKQR